MADKDSDSALGERFTSEVEEALPEMSNSNNKEHNGSGDVSSSTDGIVREDVKLPEDFKSKLAFVLYDVFSEEECKELIKKTEKMGYEKALLNVGLGRQELATDVRNNTRCIWDSPEEANRIWQRVKKHIPDTWRSRKVMGLNERLRFLKYKPGEYFKPHMDGAYTRKNGERSFITLQLYLNEGFKGGSTTFLSYGKQNPVEVVPKTGMVLIFDHAIMHEGSELVKGTKYSMRTDIMYSAEKTNA